MIVYIYIYIHTHTHTQCFVMFSHSVVSASLWPHGLQHTRLPSPSYSLGVCSNSCPLNRWCHPTILFSVTLFSSCPQSFPASGFFSVSFGSSHQVAKALELQLQHQSFQWIFRVVSFRVDWLDLLAVLGTLKSLLHHHSSKASILRRSAFFTVQLSHPYMTTRKAIASTRQAFVGKVMSLLFNMLSRSKCLLISWL